MTQSDDSIDEMLQNSSSWSESSDEPIELKGKVVLIRATVEPRKSSARKSEEKADLRISQMFIKHDPDKIESMKESEEENIFE